MTREQCRCRFPELAASFGGFNMPPLTVRNGIERTPPGAIPIGTRVRVHDGAVSRYAGESGEVIGGVVSAQGHGGMPSTFTYNIQLDRIAQAVMILGSQVYEIPLHLSEDVLAPDQRPQNGPAPSAHRLLMMGQIDEYMAEAVVAQQRPARFRMGDFVRPKPGALDHLSHLSSGGRLHGLNGKIIGHKPMTDGTNDYTVEFMSGTSSSVAFLVPEDALYPVPGTHTIDGALIARDVNGKVIFEIMPNGVRALKEINQTLTMSDEKGRKFIVKVEILGGEIPDAPKPVSGGRRKLKL